MNPSENHRVKKKREMVPQPHGGALLPGAGGGPQPGSGRPREEVRSKFRELLEDGFPVLEDIIKGRVPLKMVGICEKCGHEHDDYEMLPSDPELLSKPTDRDRLRAIDMSARFGLGENKVEKEFVMELAHEMAQIIRPLPNGKELLERIKKAWMPIVAKRL